MTLETSHNIGDKINVGGRMRAVRSVHLYKGKNIQTERYYLGRGDWITIKVKGKKGK